MRWYGEGGRYKGALLHTLVYEIVSRRLNADLAGPAKSGKSFSGQALVCL